VIRLCPETEQKHRGRAERASSASVYTGGQAPGHGRKGLRRGTGPWTWPEVTWSERRVLPGLALPGSANRACRGVVRQARFASSAQNEAELEPGLVLDLEPELVLELESGHCRPFGAAPGPAGVVVVGVVAVP
jgi:hypothetical protein